MTQTPWTRRIPKAGYMIGFITVVFVIGLAVLAAGFIYIDSIEKRENSSSGLIAEAFEALSGSSGERPFKGSERMNILCLGIDYNRDSKGIGYTKGARSDSILVASIDSKGKTCNVVSIPRDCYVYINDEYGYDKINAAYMYGGIELAKKTVSNFLGIPIHHYVILKVYGAYQMVDALGGLQVDVEKDMDYDDNWGKLHIHLKKGEQLLRGEQAVGYGRFRMDEEGDRGRMRRQQQVLRCALRRLKDPMVVLRLQSIVKSVKNNVETDLSLTDLLDLTYLYKDFDFTQIKSGYIVGDDVEINGAACIDPYDPVNEKTIRELLKDPSTLQLKDVRIEILNASGVDRAAGKAAQYLNSLGYNVVRIGDYDHICENTTVIDRLDSAAVRNGLEYVLKSCYYETEERKKDDKADVTIIIGAEHTDLFNKNKKSEIYSRPVEVYDNRAAQEPAYEEAPQQEPVYEEAPQQEAKAAENVYEDSGSFGSAPEEPKAPPAAESWKDSYDNNINLSEPAKTSSSEIVLQEEEAPEHSGGIEPEAIYNDDGQPIDAPAPNIVPIK